MSLEVPLPTVWLSTPQTAPHGTHQTNTTLDRGWGRGLAGQCVRSTWHKINNLSLRAAEMANLAPNTAEKHLRVARTRARRESQLESENRNEATPEAPLFVSRSKANTFPVTGELFRRVSNAQLMRVSGRVSSAAAAVDAACGESAQCSRYCMSPLQTGNS